LIPDTIPEPRAVELTMVLAQGGLSKAALTAIRVSEKRLTAIADPWNQNGDQSLALRIHQLGQSVFQSTTTTDPNRA
jgi:hypothetical protein